MTRKNIYALVVVIALLIIAAGAWYWTSQTQNPGAPNPDMYPLYSGVVWSAPATTTMNGATALEITSAPIIGITDLSASSTPFTQYYDKKLTAAGWSVDTALETSGPGSNVTFYTKDGDFIAVSYTATFKDQSANAPEQCPCDLQFVLASGSGMASTTP